LEPINPAPPVITIFFSLILFNFKNKISHIILSDSFTNNILKNFY